MTRGNGSSGDSLRGVRLWLYAVAAMIIAMVVVGGATRLTESGLSITEWKPVTGMVPPLGPAQWQAEFDKYKTIPQYEILNKGMGLEAFKIIFWWEWAHRLLGRLIGFVFLLPFLYFTARGLVRGTLMAKCLLLFLLGGLQGAVGWWMVASGLTERTSVSQYRLAIHLTLACVILAAVVWVARGLVPARPGGEPARPVSFGLKAGAWLLVGLVLVQIFAGGVVAGLDAGMSFNTWPLMDGRFIPPADQLLLLSPAWRNLFENVLTVQFTHRMLAYGVLALALAHALQARRAGGPAARMALIVLALVSVQALLGILTLLFVVPIDLALAHQFGATVVLVAATLQASDLSRAAPAALPAPAGRMAAQSGR